MRSKDLQRLADEAAIAASTRFTVVTFVGRPPEHRGAINHRSLFLREEFTTLEDAKAYYTQLGVTDQYGRKPMIYAVTKEGYTIHVQ